MMARTTDWPSASVTVPSLGRLAEGWLRERSGTPILVVDTHTAGNPTRIIVGGIERPDRIRTVAETRSWLRDEVDWVRTRLVHEPRGGGLTCAVLPISATDSSHDIGAVILEPGSYPPMCGHCMIGLSVVVDEFDLIPGLVRSSQRTAFTIATPAGLVGAEVRRHPNEATRVSITNVDSFVVDGWTQHLDGREVHVDLLYGGDYYPTVNARDLGLPLDRAHSGEIIRLARDLSAQLAERAITDPVTGLHLDVYQVMFHEPIDGQVPSSRIAVVAPPGAIDRSPCGTGSSAMLALRLAQGDMSPQDTLETRSVIGSTFHVTAAGIRNDGSRMLVSPRVAATAHVNGFALIVADPHDAFADGFPPL